MTRTQAREIAVQLAYEMSFTGVSAEEILETKFEPVYYATLMEEDELYSENPEADQGEYIRRLTTAIYEHNAELEEYISRYSRGWKVSRISRVAVAVMKTAICEILYMDDIPNATAINEAVEIMKHYDEREVVSFVNGVLGGFIRSELGEGTPEAEAVRELETELSAPEAEDSAE